MRLRPGKRRPTASAHPSSPLRLPVEAFARALFARKTRLASSQTWTSSKVHLELLPGDGPALFDSHRPGVTPPSPLADLTSLLLPGETLAIQRVVGGGAIDLPSWLAAMKPWSRPRPCTRLIRVLPVETLDAPVVRTRRKSPHRSALQAAAQDDARSVNKTLSAVATRLSWFVGAMLGAIGLAWLVIEVGIIRHIATLTRRTRGLSRTVHADGGLERFELADLRSGDELASGRRTRRPVAAGEGGRRPRKIRRTGEGPLACRRPRNHVSPQSLMALVVRKTLPPLHQPHATGRPASFTAAPVPARRSSPPVCRCKRWILPISQTSPRTPESPMSAAQVDAPVPVRADEFPLEDVMFSHLRTQTGTIGRAPHHHSGGRPATTWRP